MTQLDVPAKNGKQNKATGVSRSSKYIFDPSAPSSSKTAKGGASDGKRPPVKPTASKASSGRASGQGGSFLTQAEKAKLDAREKKKESENCFSFLVDIKDVCIKYGVAPCMVCSLAEKPGIGLAIRKLVDTRVGSLARTSSDAMLTRVS